MGDLRLKGTCKTCRHWRPFEQNIMAGRCPVLGVSIWSKNPANEFESIDGVLQAEIAIHSSAWSLPISDVLAVRTGQDFGCIHHEPKVNP